MPEAIAREFDGVVTGQFRFAGQFYDMTFESFAMSHGLVSARGADFVGSFHMNGHYNESSRHVRLVKQYLGQHAVLYEGQLTPQEGGSFRIEGTWLIDVTQQQDAFVLQGQHSSS